MTEMKQSLVQKLEVKKEEPKPVENPKPVQAAQAAKNGGEL